jgi:cell wall assembly regulator SMI1
MAFKLPPEVEEALAKARRQEQSYKVAFANMTDENLVASAKFWMQHCNAPSAVKPDEPVYDATFWHVIIPEMLRRLSRT